MNKTHNILFLVLTFLSCNNIETDNLKKVEDTRKIVVNLPEEDFEWKIKEIIDEIKARKIKNEKLNFNNGVNVAEKYVLDSLIIKQNSLHTISSWLLRESCPASKIEVYTLKDTVYKITFLLDGCSQAGDFKFMHTSPFKVIEPINETKSIIKINQKDFFSLDWGYDDKKLRVNFVAEEVSAGGVMMGNIYEFSILMR